MPARPATGVARGTVRRPAEGCGRPSPRFTGRAEAGPLRVVPRRAFVRAAASAGRLAVLVALAALLHGVGLDRAWAQPAPPAPGGPAGAAASPRPVPVDVQGASRIDYDAAAEEYTFRGREVVVTRGDQRLAAPVIMYRAAARRAELPERGTVSAPAGQLTADHIVAELASRHLVAEGHVDARFLDEGVWTSMSADRVEATDRPDQREVVATGHVVATRADSELRGDRITYDRAAQHATVEGDAVATRGGDRLQADRIAADLRTHDAVATGHVVLDRAAEDMHGSADRATYAGGTRTAVLSGHARVTRDRDVVTADTITVNMAQHLATADGQFTIVAYPKQGQQGTPP